MSKKKKFKKYNKAELLKNVLSTPVAAPSGGFTAEAVTRESVENGSSQAGASEHAIVHEGVATNVLIPPVALVAKDIKRIGFISVLIAALYVLAVVTQRSSNVFEKLADVIVRVLHIN